MRTVKALQEGLSGIRDVLINGTQEWVCEQYLVPVRDSGALAGAIKRLLDNPSLCEEMGRAGRELAEREFGIEKVVDAHLRIYQELLDACISR